MFAAQKNSAPLWGDSADPRSLKVILSDPRAKDQTLWFLFFRAMVTSLLLAITLIYQIKDSTVIRPQDLFPIYSLIGLTYFITILFTQIIDRIKNLTTFIVSQIAYDILFTTALIYITGTQQAVFTFLYLFTIAFASFLFYRTGALYAAAFSSICFSTLLILSPIPQSEKHLMTLIFNNIAFFMVAFLSSYIAEQFQEFGIKLKKEQESIRELEDLNRIIIDNMKSGLLTTDLQNHIIYFNRAAEIITGFSLNIIYKKNIFEIFPDLKKQWFKKLSGIRNATPLRQSFIFKKYPDGELTLGFSLSPLRDANNNHCGYILLFEDLTKIIQMEQHLQRSDKLAAVGKLAAGIAHEIRNPLASVSGSIEVLSKELHVKEENKKLMDIVLKETERLNHLVNEFLDYVKPTDIPKESFDLDETIEETLNAIALDKSIPKNVRVSFLPSQKKCQIRGNKEKMKQVFWNLFRNAHQAMPKGGNIEIRLIQKEDQIQIEFSDSGIGIPKEIINKIFDPFFTTKSKGTGLGLSLVHKIVEAHEGRIFVNSKEGEGTTFTITLPTAL